MRNTPPVPGTRATSPRSAPKVESSSCAIQAARSSHWHCVQYWMAMRGGWSGGVIMAAGLRNTRAHARRPSVKEKAPRLRCVKARAFPSPCLSHKMYYRYIL
ncbi:Uncharacterised protein [Bordetella pertussis]|nr:Uncharacterised protein [Bordetella pertussis]